MPLEMLERLIAAAAMLSPRVRFIWHGGEPTLAGRRFYEHAARVQRDCAGTVFRNHIQTNGTLLDDGWLEFFREHDFHVGISLDGPPEVHDRQRVYPDGQGTFASVFPAALAAKQLPHAGVLSVITRHSLGREAEIFSLLADHFGAFDLLPYYETNPAAREQNGLTITPADYAGFITRVFDLWLERDDPAIRVRTLQQLTRGVAGLSPTLCRFSGRCADYLSVDANGDVYPCDRFDGEKELRFGNLRHSDLGEILAGEAHARFKALTEDVAEECRECRWWEVCRGDCTHYRYQGEGKFDRQSYFCAAQKRIWAHVHERLSPLPLGSKALLAVMPDSKAGQAEWDDSWPDSWHNWVQQVDDCRPQGSTAILAALRNAGKPAADWDNWPDWENSWENSWEDSV